MRSVLVMAAAVLLFIPACGRLGYDVEGQSAALDDGGRLPVLTDADAAAAAAPDPAAFACQKRPGGNGGGTYSLGGRSGTYQVFCGPAPGGGYPRPAGSHPTLLFK